jgi:hypothetical protein
MKVSELVSLLQSKNQDDRVRIAVGWADDTAFSDPDDDPKVEEPGHGVVVIRAWKSNTSGCLEVRAEEDEG